MISYLCLVALDADRLAKYITQDITRAQKA